MMSSPRCLLLWLASLFLFAPALVSSADDDKVLASLPSPACNVSHEIVFSASPQKSRSGIHVATIGCGDKAAYEIPGLLWSLAKQPQRKEISLHLILDASIYDHLIHCLHLLKTVFRSIDVYRTNHVVNLPCGIDLACFHCSGCKLFLYDILSEQVKHVLYVDADTLVLGDLAELWQVWSSKALEQKIFLAAKESGTSYSTRVKNIYGPTGINSGVLLMNLGMMRQLGVTVKTLMDVNPIPLEWPDQDLLNNWCHLKYHTCGFLACKWNIRIDYHVDAVEECRDHARNMRDGILHGNRRAFHSGSTEPKQFEMHDENRRKFEKFCKMQT